MTVIRSLIVVFLAITAVACAGAGGKLGDLRDRANDTPLLDWFIPDTVTDKAIKETRRAFENVTELVEENYDLLESDEITRYEAARDQVARAIDDYEAAMRASDPDAMVAPGEIIDSQLAPAQALMRKLARRYLAREVAERLR